VRLELSGCVGNYSMCMHEVGFILCVGKTSHTQGCQNLHMVPE
jgi:hypothetical protein